MMRFDWRAIAGIGVAGLLVAAPAARADHHEAKKSGASASEQGTGSGSEARGSGQAGVSTGAKPGEVTGAPSAAGGTSEKEQQAQAGAQQQLSGKVEKYDRVERTLSLSDSDKKLKVTDDTQVMKDGDRVSPGQIMEGDEVRASYSGSGDSLQATRIEIGSTGAASSGAGSAGASGPSGPGGTSGSPGTTSGSGTSGGSPKGTAAGGSSDTSGGSTASPPKQ
jgi:hypothetical protein